MGVIFVGAIIFFVVLYLVVKAAVQNGVMEAHSRMDSDDKDNEDAEDRIARTACPNCGKHHDIDYYKCPNCGHS